MKYSAMGNGAVVAEEKNAKFLICNTLNLPPKRVFEVDEHYV